MARDKMFDPAYQKCFTEAILKENKIRKDWFLHYNLRGNKSEAINWDEDPFDDDEDEIAVKRRDVCIPQAYQSWRMPTKEERAWPASTAPRSRTIPRVDKPPITMKPVPRDVRRILYQGISHDGEGRAEYLKQRFQDSPDEKYYFPICSSWDYGWTYGRVADFRWCPKHGRRRG